MGDFSHPSSHDLNALGKQVLKVSTYTPWTCVMLNPSRWKGCLSCREPASSRFTGPLPLQHLHGCVKSQVSHAELGMSQLHLYGAYALLLVMGPKATQHSRYFHSIYTVLGSTLQRWLVRQGDRFYANTKPFYRIDWSTWIFWNPRVSAPRNYPPRILKNV